MLGSFFDNFFVYFSCCFFDRFWLVLGCQNGAFLESKIDQNATYEFLIFIDFILGFPLFLRLGGSYVGSISFLFSHRFLHRFLVDLGVILGAFGESKSVIFGIDFGMIFACRSKSGLRAPKRGPRAAKSGPRAPKSGQEPPKSAPRAAKRAPRQSGQDRPESAQDRPKSAQDRPKTA